MNWPCWMRDIRSGFFDNLSHEWTIKFIKHRVADLRILRLIQKWLRAGVSEHSQSVGDETGYAAGGIGITADRQRVPALLSSI